MTGRIKSGLSLSSLSGMTDNVRASGASNCRVELVKTYHEIQTIPIPTRYKNQFAFRKTTMNISYISWLFKVTSGTGSNHKVVIKMQYDPFGYLMSSGGAEVYCDCKDFMFRSAYFLNQRDSLFKNASSLSKLGIAIGQAPKNLNPIICKHALAAIGYVMSNYSILMNE